MEDKMKPGSKISIVDLEVFYRVGVPDAERAQTAAAKKLKLNKPTNILLEAVLTRDHS